MRRARGRGPGALGRIWTAYEVEVAKAARLKFTYAGPLLVGALVLCAPFVYGLEGDGVSDYGFIAYTAPLALNLAGFALVLVFCANLVSSELNSGSIRSALTRPLLRRELLAAKLLLGLTYAVGMALVVSVIAWGLAAVFGDVSAVRYGGEVVYTSQTMVRTYAVALGLSLLPVFAGVGFAVMVSTLTRSPAAAIGLSVGAWLVVDTVKHPLRIAPFVFTTYLESPWQVFADRCDALGSGWFPLVYYVAAASVGALVVFGCVAVYALDRRNLSA